MLFDHDAIDYKNFQSQLRVYNMMFAFTSPSVKLDNKFNNGRGSPTIRIQGQSCHRIGNLLPLYIYDTENEISNRMEGLRYLSMTLYKLIYHNKYVAMPHEFISF